MPAVPAQKPLELLTHVRDTLGPEVLCIDEQGHFDWRVGLLNASFDGAKGENLGGLVAVQECEVVETEATTTACNEKLLLGRGDPMRKLVMMTMMAEGLLIYAIPYAAKADKLEAARRLSKKGHGAPS
jgi:hypothetical protein